jgi:hypothetical protein
LDIAGAKALKQRLGQNGADEASPAADAVDVPVDAPPIYHWTGVSKVPAEMPSSTAADEFASVDASLFRRLVPSFR